MNRWRAEYDDGIWRFYRDGMELGLYEKGDTVVDALNEAEARIAELEAVIDQLIEAGKGLLDSLCTDPEEEKTVEVMNWKAVVDKVNKERAK
jgi:hypothetical protein